MPVCTKCGSETLAGFRFCGACGEPLDAGAERELRKTVTVLFADVTGSTALGERLDPEAFRRDGITVVDDAGDVTEAVFKMRRH